MCLMDHVEAENGKEAPSKKEWVWLNGSLVYLNPKDIEPKSSSSNIEVKWQVVGGKVVPHVSEEKPEGKAPAFDPYLQSVPRSEPGFTAKGRFKSPKIAPPSNISIGFRNGDLPDPAKPDEGDVLPQKGQLRIADLTAPQLQQYGVILEKESNELKKRFEDVTKQKNPDPDDLNAYLKDSADFQVRLEAYRDRADELREEAAKKN